MKLQMPWCFGETSVVCWRWRQQVFQKCWCPSTKPHNIMAKRDCNPNTTHTHTTRALSCCVQCKQLPFDPLTDLVTHLYFICMCHRPPVSDSNSGMCCHWPYTRFLCSKCFSQQCIIDIPWTLSVDYICNNNNNIWYVPSNFVIIWK